MTPRRLRKIWSLAAEQTPDLMQAKAQPAQRHDAIQTPNITVVADPVAGVRPPRRPQHTKLVVMTQRPHAQPGLIGQLTDPP